MEEHDFELRELLREWKAPDAPASLEARVLKRTKPWWGVLIHGYIRVPVPVACCLAIVMIGGVWRLTTGSIGGCSAASASPVIARHTQEKVYTRPGNCTADSNC